MNVIAPINSLGYGVVSLNVALALERAGRRPALWPIGPVDAVPEHHQVLGEMIRRTATYNAVAPSLRIYHQFDLAQHVGKGLHCAYPFFELDRFRANEQVHLNNQDIIFVSSDWAKNVLEWNGVRSSVRVARPGVDPTLFFPDDESNHAQDGRPTIFLNIGKWEIRKGHDVLVEAFEKAFSRSDNVVLIMNCYNPCLPAESRQRYNDQFVSLYKNRLGDQVKIIKDRLPSQRDVVTLMKSVDCGVFPSRAEGWNLEALEMMALGKQVILTDYSAHTEFATTDNSLLIRVDDTEPAYDGVWFHDSKESWGGKPGEWAHFGDEQLEQLISRLRWVHDAKQAGACLVNRAGIETAKRLTWDNTASEIIAGLAA